MPEHGTLTPTRLQVPHHWASRVHRLDCTPCATTLTRSLYHTATNGIVIATEKKAPSPLIDDSMIEKVCLICPNIGVVYSGMGPDYRILVAKARKSAQAYWKVYGEYPPTRVLVQELATVMQESTQRGCVMMFACLTCPSHTFYRTEEFDHSACRCLSQAGTRKPDLHCSRSIHQAVSGLGKLPRLARIMSMQRRSSRNDTMMTSRWRMLCKCGRGPERCH